MARKPTEPKRGRRGSSKAATKPKRAPRVAEATLAKAPKRAFGRRTKTASHGARRAKPESGPLEFLRWLNPF
jgi:hypothetical protein